MTKSKGMTTEEQFKAKTQMLLDDFEKFQQNNIKEYGIVLTPAIEVTPNGIIPKFGVSTWKDPVTKAKETLKEEDAKVKEGIKKHDTIQVAE